MPSYHPKYEVPAAYVEKFAFIDVPARRLYAAQVNYLDDQVGALDVVDVVNVVVEVGRVVAALRARGLWDDMLFVMSSDNGGPLYFSGNLSAPPALHDIEGANNFPLRGGKGSITEGGT